MFSEDEDLQGLPIGQTSPPQVKTPSADGLLSLNRLVSHYPLKYVIQGVDWLLLPSDNDPNLFSGAVKKNNGLTQSLKILVSVLITFPVSLCLSYLLCRSVLSQPTSYRPRLLLEGRPGSGQSSHLAPAVLHALEKFTVYTLDMAVLFGASASAPEETCAQVNQMPLCHMKRLTQKNSYRFPPALAALSNSVRSV